MTHVEKMWRTIGKAKREYVGKRNGYDISVGEAHALIDYITKCSYSGVFAVFDLGFIRGVRWAKAAEKEEGCESMNYPKHQFSTESNLQEMKEQVIT